jgi:hypothetical protein
MGKLYEFRHYGQIIRFISEHIAELKTKTAKIVEETNGMLYMVNTDTQTYNDDQYLFRCFSGDV